MSQNTAAGALNTGGAGGALGVDVVLLAQAGHVMSVSVRSRRLHQASRVLCGRPWAEALALLPRLYSLCGQAHHWAGRLAVAAAETGNRAVELSPLPAAVAREACRELLLPMLMTWQSPPQVALARAVLVASEPRDVARVAQALAAAPESLGSGPEFAGWRDFAESPVRPCFLQLESEEGLQQVAAWLREDHNGDFRAAPLWAGEARETGTFARFAAAQEPGCCGLGARWDARLVAVREWLRWATLCDVDGDAAGPVDRPEVGRSGAENERTKAEPPPVGRAIAVADGEGVAVVETARGLLVHWVKLDGNAVADWRIVAPSDWTCHALGGLRRGLVGLPLDRVVGEPINWLLRLLDPCVPFTVTVQQATASEAHG